MKSFIVAALFVASAASLSLDSIKGTTGLYGRFPYGLSTRTIKGFPFTTTTSDMVKGVPTTTTVYPLETLIETPLFQEYLTFPVFRHALNYPAFHQYLASPLFQHLWTSTTFKMYFKNPVLFYKYIVPQVHIVETVYGVKDNIFNVYGFDKTFDGVDKTFGGMGKIFGGMGMDKIFGGMGMDKIFGGIDTTTLTGNFVNDIYKYIVNTPDFTKLNTVDDILGNEKYFGGVDMINGEDTLVGDDLVKREILKKLYWAKVLSVLEKIPSSVFRHEGIFGDVTKTNDLVDTLKYNKVFGDVMDKDMFVKGLLGKHMMTTDKDLMTKKFLTMIQDPKMKMMLTNIEKMNTDEILKILGGKDMFTTIPKYEIIKEEMKV